MITTTHKTGLFHNTSSRVQMDLTDTMLNIQNFAQFMYFNTNIPQRIGEQAQKHT